MPTGRITDWTHDQVKEALERNGITIEKAKGYDCAYVANMAYADFYPQVLPNEQAILKFVKAYIDDPDGYDGIPLTRYYADCIGQGGTLVLGRIYLMVRAVLQSAALFILTIEQWE